ncbi:hypothetical protein TNCT_574661 [Trichonephila clavata]|uniref:Serine/threonine-protein phosphatase PGAM5, mitochondrial n=1 Tax=Trichonephila clavata TaxID=2740835 RepID=A0A8X6FK49_TRICU|nr:hypothetical protein TNCT_574661 [Trichonephila clavata]
MRTEHVSQLYFIITAILYLNLKYGTFTSFQMALCCCRQWSCLGLFNYFQTEKKTVKMACTTSFQPSVKWNYNWDKRDYSTIMKPGNNKDGLPQNDEPKIKSGPTARRQILLVRHGEFDTSAEKDVDRHLTPLGREQANLVGQRLKDLNPNYTKLVRSTMTRAQETSDIILKHFPDLPVEDCDLLRESRIDDAFKKHFHRANENQTSDSHEIIVCHANVIRYCICRNLLN